MFTRATKSNAPVRPTPKIARPGPPRVRSRDLESEVSAALEVRPWSSICLPEELDISSRLGLIVLKMKINVLGFSTANRGYSRYRKCKDKERQIGIWSHAWIIRDIEDLQVDVNVVGVGKNALAGRQD